MNEQLLPTGRAVGRNWFRKRKHSRNYIVWKKKSVFNKLFFKKIINISKKLKVKGTPTWKAESHNLQIRSQNLEKTAVDLGFKNLECSQRCSHDARTALRGGELSSTVWN